MVKHTFIGFKHQAVSQKANALFQSYSKQLLSPQTQTSSLRIKVLKVKDSQNVKTRSQAKEIGEYWNLDSIHKWFELGRKYQQKFKNKIKCNIRLEDNPMKLIDKLDKMMDHELLKRCSGINECQVGSGYHKCKSCKYAIKCRGIVHHIQYMRHEGFDETDFIELLELF